MPLRFLIDENLRGPLPAAIKRHNAQGIDAIDAMTVGEPLDLPLGSTDPDILVWAENSGRILVSHDKGTIPGFFLQHLQSGRHSPGVLIVRRGASLADLVQAIATAAHAGLATDFHDQIDFIPS